ncbi:MULTISPECIES: hypothetical protein [Nocardia]|uniref:hypothetical protein n=1 Tax=Nocardia TaxID=1817 RepID=UPI0019153E48|nr:MULTISPECIES: hypothetical protein [Nocardia]
MDAVFQSAVVEASRGSRWLCTERGPPPWQRYFVTPHTAVGVGTAEPHGATRWRLTRISR